MSEVLYQDRYYRVEALGLTHHATTVVAFQARRPDFHPSRPKGFGDVFLPKADVMATMPANFVAFTASRNCWYLDAGTAPAIAAIREKFGTTRLVTYGSSLGGFAAWNLAGELGADFTLTLSPLSTLDNALFGDFNDDRFLPDRKHWGGRGKDRIANGSLVRQRGLIAYDGCHAQDRAHALRLQSLTSCILLDVPHSGHPCGKLLSKLYPLPRLLEDAIAGEPPVADIRQAIAERLSEMPEYLAAHVESFAAFLNLCRENPAAILPIAWLNAAETLHDQSSAFGESVLPNLRAAIELMLLSRAEAASDIQKWDRAMTLFCLGLVNQSRSDLALPLAIEHLPPHLVSEVRRKIASMADR